MASSIPQRLIVAAACALAGLALLPFLVTLLPRIYFDVDPLSPAGAAPITAMGPAGCAWLSVAAALLSAAVLGGCVHLRQPIAWWAVALVAAGILAQLLHMRPARPDNLWYGAAWIGGSLLGLAAYHLGQFPAARRWMIAGFLAILVPVTLDSAYFVLVEHPMTVEAYRHQAATGQASELYERRLEAPDAIGALSLSNVLGSLAGAGTLLAAAMFVGIGGRAGWIAGLCAAGGLTTVMLTRSRGAAAAMIAGLVILALLPRLDRARGRAVAVVGCVGCIVAAVAAIFVIAGQGVPAHGEGGARVSLLYRHHYWQGAAALIEEHPFLGTGQEGFSEGYLRTKNPISPEDVRSSHNVFIDWITTLGVGGWAWSALAMTWLVSGALRRDEAPGAIPDEPAAGREPWLIGGLIAGALGMTQYVFEYPMMMFDTALVWLAGLLGMFGVMGLVGGSVVRGRWAGAGLIAAATALLAHNQIDMTFHHAPSALPAWTLLGLAGAWGASPEQRPRRVDRLAPLLPLGAGAAVAVLAAMPVTNQQAHLAQAAAALRGGWGERAIHELDQAAGIIAADHVTLRWRVTLRLGMAEALQGGGRVDEAGAARRAALALCDDRAFGGVDSHRLDRWRSVVHEAMGQRSAAIEDQRRVTARSPYSVADQLRLADLLAGEGRRAEAVEAYRRTLELHEQHRLDPATQLDEAALSRARAACRGD